MEKEPIIKIVIAILFIIGIILIFLSLSFEDNLNEKSKVNSQRSVSSIPDKDNPNLAPLEDTSSSTTSPKTSTSHTPTSRSPARSSPTPSTSNTPSTYDTSDADDSSESEIDNSSEPEIDNSLPMPPALPS